MHIFRSFNGRQMAKTYDLVGDISPMKDLWNIRVRAVQMWKPPSIDNPNVTASIEMVLMDEKVLGRIFYCFFFQKILSTLF